MSCEAILWRRLKYMLTPQFDLYKRIGERYCHKINPPRTLDYGCGTGLGTIQLAHADVPDVTGVDIDGPAVEFASEVFGNFASFQHADAAGTGALGRNWAALLEAGEFELVTLIEVVEHMDPREQSSLILAIARGMDGSGRMILSTPNKRSQFRKHGGHVGMHDQESLLDLLIQYFDVVGFEDYLGNELEPGSTVSPIVAICRIPRK